MGIVESEEGNKAGTTAAEVMMRSDKISTSGGLSTDQTSILKLVEKDMRDGLQSTTKGDSSRIASIESSNENDVMMPELQAATSDASHLDPLTLQKVVAARLDTPLPQEKGTTKEVKCALEEGKVGAIPVGFMTAEQRLASKVKTDGQVMALTAPKGHDKTGTSQSPRTEHNCNHSGETTSPPPVNLQRGEVFYQQQPGAYQGTPGEAPVRTEDLNYSLVGRESHLTIAVGSALTREYVEDQPSGDSEADHHNVEAPGAHGLHSSSRAGSSLALSVAKPVRHGSSTFSLPLPIAKEYDVPAFDSEDPEEREAKARAMRCKKTLGALLLAAVVGGVTLLLVFLLRPDTEEQSQEATAASTTAAPTLSAEEHVLSLLPASTVRNIQLRPDEAPQALAFDWMVQDPNLWTYTDSRLQQRFALATLYFATGGPNWKNQTNWLSFQEHECTWFHRNYFEDVELYMASATAHTFKLMYHSNTKPCSQNTTGAFEHLWIYKNNLEGRLPMEELYILTSLKSMALFGNELEIDLSGDMRRWLALEALEFSSLDVEGSIPSDIGLLTNMKAILASSNKIQGTIPTQYGLLSNLEYSMLSSNQLSGPLPTELGQMSSLAWLYLYGNNDLTGPIPSELGLVTTFEFLNMYTNQLTGSLPTEIGLLTRMNLIALSDNLLTGQLPSQLGRLTNIQQGLSLNRNDFTGTIPTEMGQLTTITGTITGSGTYGLGLGGNGLNGTLPTQLGRLSLLERLYVNDNDLTGSLPSELGEMASLETLWAQNNQFTGGVPEDLERIVLTLEASNDTWTEWNVWGNPLSGTVPDALCEAVVFDCSSQLCGCDCECSP